MSVVRETHALVPRNLGTGIGKKGRPVSVGSQTLAHRIRTHFLLFWSKHIAGVFAEGAGLGVPRNPN